MSQSERRKMIRTPSTVPLDLYDPKGRMVIGEGQLVNVSESGALVLSRQILRLKEKVRLHVVSGGDSPLQLLGRVVWSRKSRPGFAYGVRFDSEAPGHAG